MTLLTKLPKMHYAESFQFLTDFLQFSADGLPLDPNCRAYYARRVGNERDPAVISFSVFLHAAWSCYAAVCQHIIWTGAPHMQLPKVIASFWADQRLILCDDNPTSRDPEQLFQCHVFDLRQADFAALSALRSRFLVAAANAVVFLISDEPAPQATCSQQTPFGIVSFFNRTEWEDYCENVM